MDGIWLSPTMPSPDQDWGYDVSDYLGVHPELGTLADLDELVSAGGSAGHAGAARPGAQPHQQRRTRGSSDALTGTGAEHRD